MEKLRYDSEFSVEIRKKYHKEYKIARVVIRSDIDDVTTKNMIDESSSQESTCDNLNNFKIALNARYPEFKSTLASAIREDTIESGVHYFFEDKFDEYYRDNSYMATQLLQFFKRLLYRCKESKGSFAFSVTLYL
ncbi:MAG: hypothetical protein NC399_11405 [Muribaculum sp.]|nr:hypothetical protein [Muribaculum sp.]